jgi:hypothetical protein
MDLDTELLAKVTLAAFDRVAGDRRWEVAIVKARRQIEENPFLHWDGRRLLVLSPSGGLYEAGRICQCLSYLNRRPCWHRAAARLIQRYEEEVNVHEKVNGPCDRCHQEFDGSRTEDMTAGFYDVSPTDSPAGWDKFADPGEKIVCDRCMWTDPRYVGVYGPTQALAVIESDTAAAAARVEER